MKTAIQLEDIRTIAENIQKDAQQLAGQTLIITGGAGFVGNYIISTLDYLNKNLLKEPCKIISVDNFITGVKYHTEEHEHFKQIKHDIKNPLKLDEDVHYVIHAAGIGSPEYYTKYRIETIDVGVLGTKNMLELAKDNNAKSFMFFSSSEVYGDPHPDHVPTPETYHGNVSCTGPRSNYDESKRLGDALCTAYHLEHGVPTKIVRPFNVYGPGMRIDDYRVVPNFTSACLQGKPIPVYGDGRNTRTFCYATDGITGFLKVFLSGQNNHAYNVGNADNEISMENLATTFSSLFDNKIPIRKTTGPIDAYKTADPKRRCPDLTKIKSHLDFNPTVGLKTGLSRYISHVIDQYNIDTEMSRLFLKLQNKPKQTASLA